jgi:hypothetical protein
LGCGGGSVSAQEATDGVRAEYRKLKPDFRITALSCVKSEDSERTFECRGTVTKPGQDGAQAEAQIEALADESGATFVLVADETDYSALEESVANGSDPAVDRTNEYVDAVNQAQQDFADAVSELSGMITATSSSAEDEETLREFASAIDAVVRDFRAIDPPGRVASQHLHLIEVIESYGRDVRSAVQTLSSEDPEQLAAAQDQLLEATGDSSAAINAAIADINQELP